MSVMNEKNLLAAERKSVAQEAFEKFEFTMYPEACSGWTIEGDEYSRVLYLSSPDKDDSVIGSFQVTFEPGTANPKEIWSLNHHGDDNGVAVFPSTDGSFKM